MRCACLLPVCKFSCFLYVAREVRCNVSGIFTIAPLRLRAWYSALSQLLASAKKALLNKHGVTDGIYIVPFLYIAFRCSCVLLGVPPSFYPCLRLLRARVSSFALTFSSYMSAITAS